MHPSLRATVCQVMLVVGLLPIAISAQDKNKEFFRAIEKDDLEKVNTFLLAGVSPDLKDGAGTPALIVASDRRAKRAFVALLEKGADPNLRSEDGSTPLMLINEIPGFVRVGFLVKVLMCRTTLDDALIKPLIDRNADVNAKSNSGITPLMAAARCGHTNAVDMIISKGADVNALDVLRQTALIMAAGPTIAQNNANKGVSTADASTVSTLLQHGANANAADLAGDTPLIRAARWGYDAKIAALLEGKADPNLANDDGDTPLIIAIRARWEKAATLLVRRGADVNVANKKGEKAITLARGSLKKLMEAAIK